MKDEEIMVYLDKTAIYLKDILDELKKMDQYKNNSNLEIDYTEYDNIIKKNLLFANKLLSFIELLNKRVNNPKNLDNIKSTYQTLKNKY